MSTYPPIPPTRCGYCWNYDRDDCWVCAGSKRDTIPWQELFPYLRTEWLPEDVDEAIQ